MYQIVCTDMLGQTHDVDADQMRLHTSAHGVHITEQGVLLVKDKLSEQWIIPGGVLDKTEKELDGMRRGILAETGITIGNEIKLLTIIEEDFFDIYLSEGSHVTRIFYHVKNIVGGTLMQNGNGVYTSAAQYVAKEVVERYSEKEMNKKYKEILMNAFKKNQ
jgi:ADP-ribose pyrophosphatase YjhB (NUDIX family)